MRDLDSEAQKNLQQKNFAAGANDARDDKQHIVGITTDGEVLKRDRHAEPEQPRPGN